MSDHDTDEYDDLLTLENVLGWDIQGGTVVALVETKVPEEELPEDQLVSNNVDGPTDVIQIGDVHAESTEASDVHRRTHRPVVAGVSEGPTSRRSAGTGSILARVTDADSDRWADGVEAGDLVRLSNNHVYAGTAYEPGQFGETIVQQSQLDGGSERVGDLIGYVPLADGVTVDVAAREADPNRDAEGILGVETEGIRESFDDWLHGTSTKSGRTTGVSSAQVVGTSATVSVGMGDRRVIFRDQIVTTDMSKGGDSGSPVVDEHGRLAGLLFAGSDTSTIVCKITNVESELGVSVGTEAPEPEPFELQVGTQRGRRDRGLRAFPYAFEFAGEATTKGRSSTSIGNVIVGYVAGWRNIHRISGSITQAWFPADAPVYVDGERIDPDDLTT